MSQYFSLSYPQRSVLWGQVASATVWRNVLLLVAGVCLLAVSAKIAIPLQPVPITLQTMALLIIAMTYGAWLGMVTVLVYVLLGLMGLPLFAIGKLGATFGYLIGFVPAAYAAGFLLECGWARHWGTIALAGLIAYAIVFACGLTVLSQWVGWSGAISVGLLPFIGGDVVKLTIATVIARRVWRQ